MEHTTIDTLLHLFHQLQVIAIKFKGEIPKEKSLKLSISRLLELFRQSCILFHRRRWVEIKDVSTIHPKLLYLIIFNYENDNIFKFLSCPTRSPSYRGSNFDLFMKIKNSYEKWSSSIIGFGNFKLKEAVDLSNFIHTCIETNGNPCGLEEGDYWLNEVFLQLLPMFKRDFHLYKDWLK
jgi:hypothetical protein